MMLENDDAIKSSSPRKYPPQNMMNGSPRKKSPHKNFENPWVRAARDLERLKERSLSTGVRIFFCEIPNSHLFNTLESHIYVMSLYLYLLTCTHSQAHSNLRYARTHRVRPRTLRRWTRREHLSIPQENCKRWKRLRKM